MEKAGKVMPRLVDKEKLVLLAEELFGKSTSYFITGHYLAVKDTLDEIRKRNGIREGTPLYSSKIHTMHGAKVLKSHSALHASGVGLTGIVKMFYCAGLPWIFEVAEHEKFGPCIRVTIDIEKNYHVFIRGPLKDCEYDGCNGNYKCSRNHARGFYAAGGKKIEKVKKVKKEPAAAAAAADEEVLPFPEAANEVAA